MTIEAAFLTWLGLCFIALLIIEYFECKGADNGEEENTETGRR